MNATEDTGGHKARKGRHPVQMAQSRRHKNAQLRKNNKSARKQDKKVVLVGDARDTIVQNILREQEERLEGQGVRKDKEDRLTLKEAFGAFFDALKDGLKSESVFPKKNKKKSFFDLF